MLSITGKRRNEMSLVERYPTLPRVILFDLWKTLARGLFIEPIMDLWQILGRPDIDYEQFMTVCLTTDCADAEAYLKSISNRFSLRLTRTTITNFKNLIENERNGISLFLDVEPELANLKRSGFKLGLVTNCWSFSLQYIMQATNLQSLLDCVVSSHEVGVAKQQGSQIYQLAVSRFDAKPHECLMIGDNPELDIEAARSAGLKAVLIDRDGTYASRRQEMTVIRNLRELRQLSRSLTYAQQLGA